MNEYSKYVESEGKIWSTSLCVY